MGFKANKTSNRLLIYWVIFFYLKKKEKRMNLHFKIILYALGLRSAEDLNYMRIVSINISDISESRISVRYTGNQYFRYARDIVSGLLNPF